MSLAIVCGMMALMQPAGGEAGVEIKPTQLWGDRLQDESLRKFAPANEVVDDPEAFAKIWNAWRPAEDVPEIDFTRSLVLVATADGPNRMFANIRNADGNVTAVYGSTKIGGPGFGYLIAVVPREGIESINGRPLAGEAAGEPAPLPGEPAPAPEDPQHPAAGAGPDFVRMSIHGTIETGLVAIGGETTGTVVKSKGMTFELALVDDDQRKLAESLNGKRAQIIGELRMEPGVERGPRWIVDVRKIAPVLRGRSTRN